MIKIKSAFPPAKISPEEIFANCGSEVEFQKEKLGIYSRHILSDSMTGFNLAQEASNKLFEEENIDKNSIEFLIYVTQNPEYILPQNSSLLQHALGLPTTVCAFDVNLGCSGYVYALSTAKALMLSEGFKKGIIITADCYSKIIDKSDKNTASIFGDCATATYIDNKSFIGFTDYGTDGAQAMQLHAKKECHLYMNGRAIFNFMMARVEPSLKTCLEKNKLSIDNIEYFIFHQASKFLLETLIKQLNLDPNKVPINIQNTANTVSSSIPLILENLINEDTLHGKTCLLCGFGVGLSWATTIVKF